MPSVMRFGSFLILLFCFCSCNEQIPTEREIIENIQGLWEVTEIKSYAEGIERQEKFSKSYWNFNQYNDLVIYSDKGIQFVAPISYDFKTEKSKSGDVKSRNMTKVILGTAATGEFKINGKKCIGEVLITSRPEISIYDAPNNAPILVESPSFRELSILNVQEAANNRIIFKCECYYLEDTSKLFELENAKVTIRIERAKDQSLTNKLFAKADGDLNSNKTAEASQNAENLYRNETYKFRIRYPETWESIKGDSKLTVAKFARRDSAKTLSILVEEVSGPMKRISIADERIAFEQGLKARNMDYKNLNVEEGFLHNYPALIVQYDHKVKTIEYEMDYMQKQIMCYHEGYIYTISIAMPKYRYDLEERNRLNKMVGSFVFEE